MFMAPRIENSLTTVVSVFRFLRGRSPVHSFSVTVVRTSRVTA